MAIKSTTFSIKSPNRTRRTFAVVKDIKHTNGKRDQPQVEDDRLKAINTNLLRKLITVDDAYAEVKSLVGTLKVEAGIAEKERLECAISDNNRKVYLAFWKDKYENGNLVNETSTRNDLLGALRAIDPLSITSATKDDLRTKLSTLPTKQQRRYCIRINQLLEFLGRGFSTDKMRRQSQEVDFVTWDELSQITPHIYSDEVKSLAVALWGTGVRIGEAFTKGFTHLKPNNTIYISKQIDLKLKERGIKNGKLHHTMLLPQAKDAYLKWCAVEDKLQFRITAINQIIRASQKAFPNVKEKQVSAHDLRHSYAIHLLGMGASLTQIAQVLGDSVATVELHYTGFVMTDEAVSNLQKLLPR